MYAVSFTRTTKEGQSKDYYGFCFNLPKYYSQFKFSYEDERSDKIRLLATSKIIFCEKQGDHYKFRTEGGSSYTLRAIEELK